MLLCAAFLLPRLGDAHLHLCLDGSAPAVALHLSGGEGGDTADGTDPAHQDQTVDMSSPILAKAWPPGLDGALILVALLFVLLTGPFRLAPVARLWLLPASLAYLRPPLRGPPA